jgi:hypothetical protein
MPSLLTRCSGARFRYAKHTCALDHTIQSDSEDSPISGLLILLRNRWLLLFGAFINAMVILFFFNMYQGRPAVMFSPGGLVSKIAQILLEVALLYVIAIFWRKSSN